MGTGLPNHGPKYPCVIDRENLGNRASRSKTVIPLAQDCEDLLQDVSEVCRSGPLAQQLLTPRWYPKEGANVRQREIRSMMLVSVLLTALGVALSTLGGLVYCGGSTMSFSLCQVVPQIDCLLVNPGAVLGAGVLLILIGFVSCPRHSL